MQVDVANGFDHCQQLVLAMLTQVLFQLRVIVKVVFDGAFVVTGDDQNVFNAGSKCFFNDVLNCWFIYDWQHFLGASFSCGQKAGA